MIEEDKDLMSFRQALAIAFDGAQIQKAFETKENDGRYYLAIGESLYFQNPNGLRDVCRESFEELNNSAWTIREYPKQKPSYADLQLLMRRTIRELEVAIDSINEGLKP